MIYLQLFLSFIQVGLFSVGGGYAAIPLIQNQVVESHSWLTMSEFTDLVTIAEMTPGPITINSATFVGIRIAGISGAVAATFGAIFPACILVTLLAYIYRKYQGAETVSSVLASLRPVIVALIAAAGLSMFQTVVLGGDAISLSSIFSQIQWIGAVLFIAAFFALRRFKLNPILVMCLCGAASLVIYAISGGTML